MSFKDRIKELRRVPASELAAHPNNFRRHPDHQQRVLSAVLDEVGFADAVLARETENGLELIDGHLRAEIAGDELVPVLVLDVDAAEASKLLATIDPIAALAAADTDAYQELLKTVETSSEELAEFLGAMLEAEPTSSGFGDFSNSFDLDTVDFKFGDYSGKASKAIYESFVTEYERRRQADGSVLLDEVLEAWLDLST